MILLLQRDTFIYYGRVIEREYDGAYEQYFDVKNIKEDEKKSTAPLQRNSGISVELER